MLGPYRHGLGGFPEQRVNLCEAGGSFVEPITQLGQARIAPGGKRLGRILLDLLR